MYLTSVATNIPPAMHAHNICAAYTVIYFIYQKFL